VDAIAGSFPRRSFDDFHRRELPDLVTRHGALVAADLRDAPPLAFRVGPDLAVTWRAAHDGKDVGDGADTAGTLGGRSGETMKVLG
jgi:hypothetical protein